MSALSLNGLLVSSGKNFSRVSKMRFCTTGLPSSAVVRMLNGIVLTKFQQLIRRRRCPKAGNNPISPDGRIILVRRGTRLKESVLVDMNTTLLLCDREHGVTHLHIMFERQ